MEESKKLRLYIEKLPEGLHFCKGIGTGFCDLCAGEFTKDDEIFIDKDDRFKLDIIGHKRCSAKSEKLKKEGL